MTLADAGGSLRRLFPPGRWRNRRELDRWITDHRARLLRLAWAWSGDPLLADDLVQETFSRAVRSAASLRNVERVEAWMIRIMHHVYLDHLKAAVRRELPVASSKFDDGGGPGTVANAADGPESVAMANQRAATLWRAVAALPLAQRQVVTLVDLQEMSYAECARALDVPVGTVMSRLSRARATLKDRLADPADVRLRRVK